MRTFRFGGAPANISLSICSTTLFIHKFMIIQIAIVTERFIIAAFLATRQLRDGKEASQQTQHNIMADPAAPGNGVLVFNANAQAPRQPRNQMNTVSQYRDRLFHAIFFKTSVAYGTRFSPYVLYRHDIHSDTTAITNIANFISSDSLMRRIIEMFFLAMALGSFFTLAYIHVSFTQSPSTCLDHVRDTWPRDGVLRVEILPPEMQAARDLLATEGLRPGAHA